MELVLAVIEAARSLMDRISSFRAGKSTAEALEPGKLTA